MFTKGRGMSNLCFLLCKMELTRKYESLYLPMDNKKTTSIECFKIALCGGNLTPSCIRSENIFRIIPAHIKCLPKSPEDIILFLFTNS
jgi:hypothetical protein